jgi:hypothetical protein
MDRVGAWGVPWLNKSLLGEPRPGEKDYLVHICHLIQAYVL